MKDSDKERTKLSATFLSNFGLAIVVAGFGRRLELQIRHCATT